MSEGRGRPVRAAIPARFRVSPFVLAIVVSLLLHLWGLLALGRIGVPPAPSVSVVTEVDLVPLSPPAEPEPPSPPPLPPSSPPVDPPRPLPPPPPPQLRPAPLTERSRAPRPAPPERGISAPSGGMVRLGAEIGSGGGRAAARGELSQSAQDFILAQVIRMWRFDTAAGRGRGIVFSAVIEINADGTLSGAMNRSAPWAPTTVIAGYDRLADSYVRRGLESFLLALRMAQPLDLPPDDGKGWPRRMTLRFRLDDL